MWPATATERFFAGDLDDVRIWNVARNPQQISEAMGSRLGGTEAGLVGVPLRQPADDSRTTRRRQPLRPSSGHPEPATSPPDLAELDGFDVPADLTIEAWVNPTQTSDVGRVVQHQSDASNYTLGLHLGRSALHFNGTTDSAVIAAAPALDITGPITLEAWINADKTDGLRDVFGHGYVSNPAGEVVLRIQNGSYYVGAYDGHDHGVAAPMPATDRKTWVHLAGVYDGSAWRLYRNGVLVGKRRRPGRCRARRRRLVDRRRGADQRPLLRRRHRRGPPLAHRPQRRPDQRGHEPPPRRRRARSRRTVACRRHHDARRHRQPP